jgi:hypothetical protein
MSSTHINEQAISIVERSSISFKRKKKTKRAKILLGFWNLKLFFIESLYLMCLWKGAIQIDPFQKTLNANKCDVVMRKKLHTLLT